MVNKSYRQPVPLLAGLLAVNSFLAQASVVSFDDVLVRLSAYLAVYEVRLKGVVAEERYEQRYSYDSSDRRFGHPLGKTLQLSRRRVLVSDVAFMREAPDDAVWLGVRETHTADGVPVHDQDSLFRSSDFFARAAGLSAETSPEDLAPINTFVNMPTIALQLLEPDRRHRLVLKKAGEERLDGRVVWRIDYRDSGTPRLIATPDHGSAMGSIWVDPIDGTILKTVLDLNRYGTTNTVRTRITVTYGLNVAIGFVVPIAMVEHHFRGDDNLEASGIATYSNFRRPQE